MHTSFAPVDSHSIPIHALRASETAKWLDEHSAAVRAFAGLHEFGGQAGKLLLVPMPDGSAERILLGLGETPDAFEIGGLSGRLPAGTYHLATAPSEVSAQQVLIAWALGTYAFDRYKPRPAKLVRLVPPAGTDPGDATAIAEAVFLARNLVNTPANDMGPEALEAAALELAGRFGAHAHVVRGEELLSDNYPMIHAVGRAAAQAPRYVEIIWGPESAPKLALVGKGVTFDSGGLDIKPSAGMRIMKKDMGGAACVLALGQLIMAANLNVRLSLHIAIVENAISASAFRPGDVLASRKGLSVEIDNTDAEGRLILGDALARASELGPELVIDMATLTGAARVALGPDVMPFYTQDDGLAGELFSAGKDVGDPVWRMPLWAGYESDIESPIAHLKNSGGPMAGSVTAALFLQHFVSAPAWVHFDVYCWNVKDRPARPAGGEAMAIRALYRVLKRRYPAISA
jgi:leucyl aminopeptidase